MLPRLLAPQVASNPPLQMRTTTTEGPTPTGAEVRSAPISTARSNDKPQRCRARGNPRQTAPSPDRCNRLGCRWIFVVIHEAILVHPPTAFKHALLSSVFSCRNRGSAASNDRMFGRDVSAFETARITDFKATLTGIGHGVVKTSHQGQQERHNAATSSTHQSYDVRRLAHLLRVRSTTFRAPL